MKWFTERAITLAFAVIVIFVSINAFLSYRSINTLIENERKVAHSHDIIAGLELVLSTMKDAETGQRGFIITGDDGYLAPYRAARDRIDSQVTYVRGLISDSPYLQLMPQLELKVRQRLDTLQQNIIRRQSQGMEAARVAVLEGHGKELMDSIRLLTSIMEGQEREVLAIRSAESREGGNQATLTFIIANAFAITLVVGLYILLNRDLRSREQRERELRAAHDELEQRVVERTAELTQANSALISEIEVRRQTEAKLQEFTVELERSNRELQDFAFVASHDLQEPLRKIQAFGDRLKTKYGPMLEASGADYVERMQAAAQRMHILINDLLTFSRVASKAQPFVPVSLNNIAEEVLGDLEVRIQQSGGGVELGALPGIEADPLQMRQLFQNLIGNALKFHRPDVPPRVTVHGEIKEQPSESAPGLCEIRVEDNGIGFEEQYLDKIFTPFQRLHGRTEYEGTGMGLAVCRKIVERHKGMITARSTPGSGTTFIVHLPISHNQRPA